MDTAATALDSRCLPDPGKRFKALSVLNFPAIFKNVNRLTKQEQLVLCLVIGLLLTGWAVKWFRTAHPPTGLHEPSKH